jgi:hypothetical protein
MGPRVYDICFDLSVFWVSMNKKVFAYANQRNEETVQRT